MFHGQEVLYNGDENSFQIYTIKTDMYTLLQTTGKTILFHVRV